MKIHHEISLSTTPQRIFEALTNETQFSEFTRAPAEIDLVPGGQFSCFGGMITGLTLEAIPGIRLVQAWRVGNWNEGIYSIVKFELEAVTDAETKLVFDHTGFPDEHRDSLDEGWHDRYWKPMKSYLKA
jgi:activator of HSP90 ATPase